MSPYLPYEIVPAPQQESESQAINSDPSHSRQTAINRRRSVKHRVGQVVAVLGVCGAAGTFTLSDAFSSQGAMKQHAVPAAAQHLMREIQTFEAKGYVPTACTVSGTLMRNYSTGQSVTVK